MSIETLIARRYLFSKDKSFMVSFLALVGMVGVLISVFALIVVQSVMAGFSSDLRSKILRFTSPIVLKPTSAEWMSGKKSPTLPADSRIIAIFPYLETEAIVHTEEEATQGVKLKGVDLKNGELFKKLNVEFVEGFGVENLTPDEKNPPGILLGSELAKKINILPVLTEEIDLIYPFGEVDPTGEMRPKKRRFRVIGTFKSGYYDTDNKFAIVDLNEARRLVPSSEVPTEWGIELKDFFDAEKVEALLPEDLKKSFQVTVWKDRHQKLFQALRLERLAMFCLLGLMILISSFNLFSLTMMMTVDKRKEIAVLRALGLTQKRIEKTFSRIALLLGGVGTFLGLILSLGVLFFLKWRPLKVPTAYYLESLPIKIEPISIVWVLILVPILVLLAVWYPARKGGKFEISESLRWE